ncbi:MAG TPA: plastocyanin/azurin family copper-binding protein [Gaiellaceae bacterium]|jgi:uncharacterized cupredoxin-like copper-binding protein|nr:plastocyanin/azurin family copper-binding protein [Gaiellaceae bacterium]
MNRYPLLIALCVSVAALVAALVVPSALAGSRAKTLVTTINVTAGKPSEFRFKLAKSSAKRGVIVFKIKNSGVIPHDFKLCSKRSSSLKNSCTGRGTKLINVGSSATLRVSVLVKGTYEYLCTVPGHAAQGMKGLFKVT